MSHPSELISAYLDGELTSAEVATLSQHLSSCGRCSRDLNAMQEIRSAVRSLPLLEIPDGLVPRSRSTIVPLRRNRGLLVGAAAAILAIVVAVAALVTPPAQSISVGDLNSRFGARVSLDPAFGPAKVVVPQILESDG